MVEDNKKAGFQDSQATQQKWYQRLRAEGRDKDKEAEGKKCKILKQWQDKIRHGPLETMQLDDSPVVPKKQLIVPSLKQVYSGKLRIGVGLNNESKVIPVVGYLNPQSKNSLKAASAAKFLPSITTMEVIKPKVLYSKLNKILKNIDQEKANFITNQLFHGKPPLTDSPVYLTCASKQQTETDNFETAINNMKIECTGQLKEIDKNTAFQKIGFLETHEFCEDLIFAVPSKQKRHLNLFFVERMEKFEWDKKLGAERSIASNSKENKKENYRVTWQDQEEENQVFDEQNQNQSQINVQNNNNLAAFSLVFGPSADYNVFSTLKKVKKPELHFCTYERNLELEPAENLNVESNLDDNNINNNVVVGSSEGQQLQKDKNVEKKQVLQDQNIKNQNKNLKLNEKNDDQDLKQQQQQQQATQNDPRLKRSLSDVHDPPQKESPSKIQKTDLKNLETLVSLFQQQSSIAEKGPIQQQYQQQKNNSSIDQQQNQISQKTTQGKNQASLKSPFSDNSKKDGSKKDSEKSSQKSPIKESSASTYQQPKIIKAASHQLPQYQNQKQSIYKLASSLLPEKNHSQAQNQQGSEHQKRPLKRQRSEQIDSPSKQTKLQNGTGVKQNFAHQQKKEVTEKAQEKKSASQQFSQQQIPNRQPSQDQQTINRENSTHRPINQTQDLAKRKPEEGNLKGGGDGVGGSRGVNVNHRQGRREEQRHQHGAVDHLGDFSKKIKVENGRYVFEGMLSWNTPIRYGFIGYHINGKQDAQFFQKLNSLHRKRYVPSGFQDLPQKVQFAEDSLKNNIQYDEVNPRILLLNPHFFESFYLEGFIKHVWSENPKDFVLKNLILKGTRFFGSPEILDQLGQVLKTGNVGGGEDIDLKELFPDGMAIFVDRTFFTDIVKEYEEAYLQSLNEIMELLMKCNKQSGGGKYVWSLNIEKQEWKKVMEQRHDPELSVTEKSHLQQLMTTLAINHGHSAFNIYDKANKQLEWIPQSQEDGKLVVRTALKFLCKHLNSVRHVVVMCPSHKKHKHASYKNYNEALQTQSIFGGSLDTVLKSLKFTYQQIQNRNNNYNQAQNIQ